MGLFGKNKFFKNPCLKEGTPAKLTALLYGFYGHNLGDDLFFDYILKRYPDTLFYIIATPDYKEFFEQYNNAVFFVDNGAVAYKYNKKKEFGFEKLALKNTDFAVHIGGSIYQQIGDFKRDLEIRKFRSKLSPAFFAISNNFGPYKTEEYFDFWNEQFYSFKDICFRDKYSYNLFAKENRGNVRYAPDVLFSYPLESSEKQEKKVAVSVINMRHAIRDFSELTKDGYVNNMRALIKALIKEGYEISLISYCVLENDIAAINEICDGLDSLRLKSVKRFEYTDNLSEILNEMATAEYVIGTRFHASVLGLSAGAKVLPVCYSKKTTDVLDDIGFGDYITVEDFAKADAQELLKLMKAAKPIETNEISKLAKTQFSALDDFVKSKGGRVKE